MNAQARYVEIREDPLEDLSRKVGSVLVSRVEDWARMRHCCELKVETQNTNVAAGIRGLRQ